MPIVVAARDFDEFSRRLDDNGVTVINCPVIRTEETSEVNDLRELVREGNYDGIFVTSSAAAEILLREVFRDRDIFRGVVYVFGAKSHAVLADKVLRLSFDKNARTALEMVSGLSGEEIGSRRFLFVRGDRSLGTVKNFLGETATVDEIVVYRTTSVEVSPETFETISGLASNAVIDMFCFFSPSGAESFLAQFGGEILRSAKIATIGRTTAEFFESLGFEVALVSPKPTAVDFADCLLSTNLASRV